MNFLRDKPLKVLAVYLIAILTLTFIAEYIIFRFTLSNLTEAERKIDFARSVSNWFSFFVLVNIGGLFLMYYLFNKRVLIPLSILKKNAAQGDFTEPNKNEIGQVAEQVNATIEDLRDATGFVISIGEGKLDLDYRSLDDHYHQGKNKLADSLNARRDRKKRKELHRKDQRVRIAASGSSSGSQIFCRAERERLPGDYRHIEPSTG